MAVYKDLLHLGEQWVWVASPPKRPAAPAGTDSPSCGTLLSFTVPNISSVKATQDGLVPYVSRFGKDIPVYVNK